MTDNYVPFGYFIHNGQMIKKQYIEVCNKKMGTILPFSQLLLYTDTDGVDEERSGYSKLGLQVGKTYRAENLIVGSMYSTVKLHEIKGRFNSVCFHVIFDCKNIQKSLHKHT